MLRYWKIALPILCLVALSGGLILWSAHKKQLIEQKLVADAKAYRASAEQGDAESQFKLGSMYFYGKGVPQDYSEALVWYRKAANQGNANAEFNLGSMYYRGTGVKQDYADAIRWVRSSADQGNKRAQDGMGIAYYYGNGVSRDYSEAIRWYKKSADQGYTHAEEDLGSMYYYGQGTPVDYSQAVLWYRRAADQGYAPAQYDLGYAYYHGNGVSQNYREAYRWFRRAAAQGDERAKGAMRIGISPRMKIFLLVGLLGGALLLAGSQRSGGLLASRNRVSVIAGLLCLVWVGARLYRSSQFGFLEATGVLNTFDFARHVLTGMCLAPLILILRPRDTKTLFAGSCALLLVGIGTYAALVRSLGRADVIMRLCYLANELLIGTVLVSGLFLWRSAKAHANPAR